MVMCWQEVGEATLHPHKMAVALHEKTRTGNTKGPSEENGGNGHSPEQGLI